MCVPGTLNAIPLDKQIYIYLKVQKLRGPTKFEVWSPKSKIPAQNGCQKTYTRNSDQSVIIKITQQNSKWSSQKLIKSSPNIIVTWKVTIQVLLQTALQSQK